MELLRDMLFDLNVALAIPSLVSDNPTGRRILCDSDLERFWSRTREAEPPSVDELSIWLTPDKVAKVRKHTCKIWDRTATRGYGQFTMGGHGYSAHKVSFQHYVGIVPIGGVVDHLCQRKLCVEPGHLESVTYKENNKRAGKARRRSHCKRGHEMSGYNLFLVGRVKARRCRECINRRRRDRRAALKYKQVR